MLKTKNSISVALVFLSISFLILLNACQEKEVYMPKPRGYYRITIPDTGYRHLNRPLPYDFDYSLYANIEDYPLDKTKTEWINICYPNLNATVFISYHHFHGDTMLDQMVGDSRSFVFKQIEKADDIIESEILDTNSKIFGKTYDILGVQAACPYQFWITDREQHFFRAALYFGCSPQNDSLQPAIDYIKKDLLHLIETFKWN